MGPEPSPELLCGDREEGTGQASDEAGARGEADTGIVSVRMSIRHHFNSEHRTYAPGSPSGMQETSWSPGASQGLQMTGGLKGQWPMPGFPRVFRVCENT